MRAHYRFTHDTTLPAPLAQVHDLIVDIEHYPRWWPQIRAVAKIDDDHAIVVCRSTLPYDLELHLTAIDREPPRAEVAISGPMDGRARWSLAEHGEDGGVTRLHYEQEVSARGKLRFASYLVRPLLVWNHAVMMRGFDRGSREVLSAGSADRTSG
ncbi:MAG TPA: SRPBCC family protein [Marmoricola sp.]